MSVGVSRDEFLMRQDDSFDVFVGKRVTNEAKVLFADKLLERFGRDSWDFASLVGDGDFLEVLFAEKYSSMGSGL